MHWLRCGNGRKLNFKVMADPDFEALWKRALHEFRSKGSIHGPDHWHRVEANGLQLAELTEANIVVVRLFAVFHDSKRQNDNDDP